MIVKNYIVCIISNFLRYLMNNTNLLHANFIRIENYSVFLPIHPIVDE